MLQQQLAQRAAAPRADPRPDRPDPRPDGRPDALHEMIESWIAVVHLILQQVHHSQLARLQRAKQALPGNP